MKRRAGRSAGRGGRDVLWYPRMDTQANTTEPELWIHNQARPLHIDMIGPFVTLDQNRLLTVDDRNVLESGDGGHTWETRPLLEYQRTEKEFKISRERILLRTQKGTLILSFMNLNERRFTWSDELHDILPGNRLPHYVTRSLDHGQTWEEPRMLHESWTGEIRNAIQTRSGRIVISSMNMLSDPGRHAVLTYSSDDEGSSWTRSNIIDLGGNGHHGGVTEATIAELTNGRLWMLIRTNWGRFWQAYSDDEGLSWREIGPTRIDASSAPGLLTRLHSGRLMLLWNRTYPEGTTDYPLRGGDCIWSEVPVSNHREELSLAMSDDDGGSWSHPVVIARQKDAWLSYPRVLEHSPGELWITTMQGGLRLVIQESDFVEA